MTPKNDFLNNSLWLCRSVFGPQSTDVTGELVGNADFQHPCLLGQGVQFSKILTPFQSTLKSSWAVTLLGEFRFAPKDANRGCPSLSTWLVLGAASPELGWGWEEPRENNLRTSRRTTWVCAGHDLGSWPNEREEAQKAGSPRRAGPVLMQVVGRRRQALQARHSHALLTSAQSRPTLWDPMDL